LFAWLFALRLPRVDSRLTRLKLLAPLRGRKNVSPWWSPAPDKTWEWPLGKLEYPLYVRTRIDWWSNASPTWHNFVDTLYPGTFDLYAGSGDVKFRVTFMRDWNNNTNMQVNWKYCLD
jgi:hypothetical protein